MKENQSIVLSNDEVERLKEIDKQITDKMNQLGIITYQFHLQKQIVMMDIKKLQADFQNEITYLKKKYNIKQGIENINFKDKKLILKKEE